MHHGAVHHSCAHVRGTGTQGALKAIGRCAEQGGNARQRWTGFLGIAAVEHDGIGAAFFFDRLEFLGNSIEGFVPTDGFPL